MMVFPLFPSDRAETNYYTAVTTYIARAFAQSLIIITNKYDTMSAISG